MYNRNKVFAAACSALLLFGMSLITLGSILPLLTADYAAAGLSQGILVAVLPLGILAGSLIFGPIVDRYGYKLLLIISVLISAFALEGLAFFKTPGGLYACIFFAGFGGGIINGGGSALVSDISPENKGASLSLFGVFFGVGALGMPLLLGLFDQYHYTTILAAVGLFMLLPVFFFLFTRFPAPKQAQGFPLQQGFQLLKEPVLLLTSFFLFFQSGVEALANNWTTLFLEQKLEVSHRSALIALSFSVLGLTVARLLLGSLLKKISSFIILRVSLLLILTGCAVLALTDSYNLAFAGLIITGMGMGTGFPVLLGYIGQLYAQLSGTAFGIALVIALGGNALINYSFGELAKNSGIQQLPFMIIGAVLCMWVLLWLIKRKIGSRLT